MQTTNLAPFQPDRFPRPDLGRWNIYKPDSSVVAAVQESLPMRTGSPTLHPAVAALQQQQQQQQYQQQQEQQMQKPASVPIIGGVGGGAALITIPSLVHDFLVKLQPPHTYNGKRVQTSFFWVCDIN